MMTRLTRRTFGRWLTAGFASCGWGLPSLSAWENAPGMPKREIRLTAQPDERKPPVISALRLHPNGRLLAAAGDDHFVRWYDLESGQLIKRSEGHRDWVRSLDFSPDGKTLYSAGNDRRILAWSTDETKASAEFANIPHAISAVRCAKRQPWLAVVGFGPKVFIYDTGTKKLLHELNGPSSDLRTVAFNADDSLLAAAGALGKIHLWNAATGELVLESTPLRRVIHSLAFSPDGKYLAAGGDDREIHITPVTSQSPGFMLPQTAAKIRSLIFFSPHQLASGGSDNQIHVWDVHERRKSESWPGHRGTVVALENGPNSMLSASYDAEIRLWSAGDRVAKDVRPLDPIGRVPREETVR